MFNLRPILPSQITAEELGVLSTLRVIYDDCSSDLTLTLNNLRSNATALDASTRITVAEIEGQIVGWSTVENYQRQNGAYVVLLNVYVNPAYRGHGIGTALAQAADQLRTQVSDQMPDFETDQAAAPFYRQALPQYLRVVRPLGGRGFHTAD